MLVVIINIKVRRSYTFMRVKVRGGYTFMRINVYCSYFSVALSDAISRRQYQKIAKVSRATTTRDLAQLVDQLYLVKTGAGGRSTRYVLAFTINDE